MTWAIAYNPQWSFGDIVQAVIAAIVVIAGVPTVLRWLVKKQQKHSLFKPEYQHSQTSIAFNHEVEASQNSQYVQLTLRMSLDTHVEFISIRFEGQGTLPVIKDLDDWQWKKKPYFLERYELPEDPMGRWYWRYDFPEHRLRKSRITIGMKFLATDYFDGHIVVSLTCVDGAKDHALPFKVRKRSTI
jgi:hypothetical protein